MAEKGKKDGQKKKKKKDRLIMRPPPDPTSAPAVRNAYHMSFNAAIFLKIRGLPWPFDKKEKKPKKEE
ncbi:hypothetical protein NPIL_477551 [Nephila pilipes]|uniref:Small lysine-rich protein 1 n=1 Tax=Nephila pilipes TaxID=299642 RepID=A0A8X6PRX6_NEPPI|nr:hypothetical protein NPIL_477551 [Nephila pilipes]